MISQCPQCQKKLRLGSEQAEKLKKALAALEGDKKLTMKCPSCGGAIILDNSAILESKASLVPPPPPPDLDWLASGDYQGEEKVEDVPMALLVHEPTEQRDSIQESIEFVGYQVVVVDSAAEAMERMRFVNFACVVLHADLEGSLEQSLFHTYMRDMAMERRRYIFYILIGKSFHTLYGLEALANSANLVVNEEELKHLGVILRRSIPDYEELFGPILEELSVHGKR